MASHSPRFNRVPRDQYHLQFWGEKIVRPCVVDVRCALPELGILKCTLVHSTRHFTSVLYLDDCRCHAMTVLYCTVASTIPLRQNIRLCPGWVVDRPLMPVLWGDGEGGQQEKHAPKACCLRRVRWTEERAWKVRIDVPVLSERRVRAKNIMLFRYLCLCSCYCAAC